MESTKQYKVLVAEDDPFQRLSIIDILTMSNYEVTAVENGEQALEQLGNTSNKFDLVLCDLLMPELTGKDVLEAMMSDSRLSKIPMIVMSARNDRSIISEGLAKGAKTFIVKPLRVAEVRGFESYIKEVDEESLVDKNLGKYTILKHLGTGSAGKVDLVRNEEDGQLYALKIIELDHLNEKERESAECEVHFLRVLTGPTLIKSYHSFVEKDRILIFMEYAEGGNLADLITQAKMKDQKFSTEIALNWISQVILGVMLMHSKNILHRDLKGQNLFLTSDGVIKIGDFGISKELPTLSALAKTAGGTPYFMPPEVGKGEPYNEKTDIWAIGCILYEIVFLKKPFDSDTLSGVFDKIVNMPLGEFYEEIDGDIEMLITAMLDKDPKRRPSIWELASTPCISDCIQNFVQEKGCQKEVAGLFDHEFTKNKKIRQKQATKKQKGFDFDRLDILSHYIRNDVKLSTSKSGWFSQVENGATGASIVKWIKENVDPDEAQIAEISQKMLENGFISRIDGKTNFESSTIPLYTFFEDKEDLADNMFRSWRGNVSGALEISCALVRLIEEVYRLSIVEVDYQTKIIAEKAIKSKKYEKYLSNVGELEKVELNFYSELEAYGFFGNVYQCMYIHGFLKNLNKEQAQDSSYSMLSNLTKLVWKNSSHKFFYGIGGLNFTLDEMKHGVLRANRKKPGAILRLLSTGDPRAQFISDNNYDQRILFLCLDLPQVMEHIECFDDPDTMGEKLNFYLKEYFNVKIEVDTINEELVLPGIFATYGNDFGSKENIFNFISEFYDNSDYDLSQIGKSLSIKFVN